MRTIGIDIGTTTISGVVLEKNETQKARILEAKTIENGSFFKTTKDWERIQDAEKIVKKSRQINVVYYLKKRMVTNDES